MTTTSIDTHAPQQDNESTSTGATLQHKLAPLLYLLTNDDDFELLYQKLEVVLASGVVGLLQIRRKQVLAQIGGRDQVLKEAQKIIELAQHYAVPVIMNDDIELASQLGVGVHLGQGDGSVRAARQALGPQALIGRTCHQSAELVQAAKREGASYAAMGAVFASSTKPEAKLVDSQQIREGCDQGIDICVIGGITVENALTLKGYPIRYIAVVGDVLNYPLNKIAARCQQWQQVLNNW